MAQKKNVYVGLDDEHRARLRAEWIAARVVQWTKALLSGGRWTKARGSRVQVALWDTAELFYDEGKKRGFLP
jgi:hypothetical protein